MTDLEEFCYYIDQPQLFKDIKNFPTVDGVTFYSQGLKPQTKTIIPLVVENGDNPGESEFYCYGNTEAQREHLKKFLCVVRSTFCCQYSIGHNSISS